jgi:hypothetical protein
MFLPPSSVLLEAKRESAILSPLSKEMKFQTVMSSRVAPLWTMGYSGLDHWVACLSQQLPPLYPTARATFPRSSAYLALINVEVLGSGLNDNHREILKGIRVPRLSLGSWNLLLDLGSSSTFSAVFRV